MRVAVTSPYFDFFPELKAELLALYPGTKFPTSRARMSEDALIDYLKGYDAAIIGLDRFSERVCAALPDLRVVSLCSAGVDHIDPTILNRHGVRMWWAAGINKVSVSELTVCYMVLTLRRVHVLSQILYRREWTVPIGFGADLRGRTVGIHGFGHIGKAVAALLQPYGVTILACDRVDISQACRALNAQSVSFDELLERSDVVTIHLSRNSTTIGLYDAPTLDKMKPGAVLINVARGAMVDEAALKTRLESGRIAGAAFDVFDVEPANDNPLLDVPNLFASPHIGATTRESWMAMLRSGVQGIARAYRQEPGVYPFD